MRRSLSDEPPERAEPGNGARPSARLSYRVPGYLAPRVFAMVAVPLFSIRRISATS
jgi:hypothetical protein